MVEQIGQTIIRGMLSTRETLYVLPSYSTSGANGMFLASPSDYGSDVMVTTDYSSYISCSGYDAHCGFRPVVCLNSEVSITDNGDGSVTLK